MYIAFAAILHVVFTYYVYFNIATVTVLHCVECNNSSSKKPNKILHFKIVVMSF